MMGAIEGIIEDLIVQEADTDIKCCRCGNVLSSFKALRFKDGIFEEERFTADIMCPICNDIAFIICFDGVKMGKGVSE